MNIRGHLNVPERDTVVPGHFLNLWVEQVSSLPSFDVSRDQGRVLYLTSTKEFYGGTDTEWRLMQLMKGVFISQDPVAVTIPVLGSDVHVAFDTGLGASDEVFRVDAGVFQLKTDPGTDVVRVTLHVLDAAEVLTEVTYFDIDASNWQQPHFPDPLKAVSRHVQYKIKAWDGVDIANPPVDGSFEFDMRIQYSKADRS